MKAIVMTYTGPEAGENVLAAIVKALTEFGIINSSTIESFNVTTMSDKEVDELVASILCAKAERQPKKQTTLNMYQRLLKDYPAIGQNLSYENMLLLVPKIRSKIAEQAKVGENTLINLIKTIISRGKSAALLNGISESGYFLLKVVK